MTTLTSPSDLHNKFTAYLKKALSSAAGLPLRDIDVFAPMEVFGARAILRMTGELEQSFGWLSKTLYFEYSNLVDLAKHFAESYPEKCRLLLGGNVLEESSSAVEKEQALPGATGSGPTEFPRYEAGEKIAIVGLSCKFPHARDADEFWKNLRNGRDCIEEIPANRWNYRTYFDEERNRQGKTYSKWGGFLKDFDKFDPSFFNISPREAELMDPQERLFLECVYSAVEEAGYTPRDLGWNRKVRGDRSVGVFVGVMFEEYPLFRGDVHGSPASIANRVSYFCDFTGPSLSVDTMCSSSLTALHLACQSLKRDECGAAIAGGVNLTLHPNKYLMTSRLRLSSPKGRCQAFGAGGDGFVHGEGVAAVVLKTLPNALADGDHIHGVILATAVNQCGKTRNYYAPSPKAQASVISQALEAGGVSPRLITYIEAHGTGTALGDPIEISGLTNAFGKHTQDTQYCAIGSVKSNIGHCESAAGVAGLTKILLQMKHKELAPTLHVERLNANINFESTPFVVQRELEPWNRPKVEINGETREYPRIAGLSSFGGGGANAHVLLEEYVEERPGCQPETASRVAVLLSSKSQVRLREGVEQLLEAIEQGRLGDDDLWNMAYTLQVGREAMNCRLGFTAGSIAEVAEKLGRYLAVSDPAEIDPDLYYGVLKKKCSVSAAFLGDEDLAGALETCFKKGKLSKLLELWTQGVHIRWELMYEGDKRPRRIGLPTYPFARERYWVEAFEEKVGYYAKTDMLHPLVHRNTSRLGEHRFTTRFGGEEFYLTEHKVNENRVLPGVVYLEMARAAVELAWPERPDSTVLEMRNVVWTQPIVVNESKQVTITLTITGEGQIDFEIGSQDPHRAPSPQVNHCHGRMLWSRDIERYTLDLESIKRQMGNMPEGPENLYAAFSRTGIVHGPAFRSMVAVYRDERELLAKLVLPSDADGWGSMVLHPSLLDGAVQAAAGLANESYESRQPSLPFAIESLRILSAPASEMFAWARHSRESATDADVIKVDIDLCDKQGDICVEMRGFFFRTLKTERLVSVKSQQQVGTGLKTFVPVWNRVTEETGDFVPVTESTKVLLLGADRRHFDWLKETHPNSSAVFVTFDDTISSITGKLQNASFDHLLWIAPDARPDDLPPNETSASVIEQQESGVLLVFRTIKALLELGYADKELRWTLITGMTQQTTQDERVQPIHAGVHGLVGSLAKEYPHWKLTLLDLDSLQLVSAAVCLNRNADPYGNSVAYRNGEWLHQEFAVMAALPPFPAHYRQNGVYVVVGGAGGLGLVWSRFMAEQYQAKLVWIGRSEYNAAIEEKVSSLARIGRAPLYVSADATDSNSLNQALLRIQTIYPFIHGVVHSALVLQDRSLWRMDELAFKASSCTKVDVSVNIDRVFGDLDLDFILFFSSMMSFAKSAGQSNYAAGCTFKDSFAHSLQTRRRYPVKTVNWGYWGQVGIVADEFHGQSMARLGYGSIEAAEGMDALRTLINSPLAQIAVVKIADPVAFLQLAFTETIQYRPNHQDDPPIVKYERLLTHTPTRPLAPIEVEAERRDAETLLTEILAESLKTSGFIRVDQWGIGSLNPDQTSKSSYGRWLSSSYQYLRKQDVLTADQDGKRGRRSLDTLWAEWDVKKAEWSAHSELQAWLVLLEACLRQLPEILGGRRLATDVIFPDSSLRLVESIYRGHSVADFFNAALGNVLSAWASQVSKEDGRRRIRILEVGAGTGGTTAALLPLLRTLPIDEYCYSDISKAFLIHAKKRYRAHLPQLSTAIFDVSRPLDSQSMPTAHYDVVIAANVLHATPDLREALRNVKSVLRPNGLLLLNEISTWSLFTHLTFGLLDGWWLYEDACLRLPGTPAVAPETWERILRNEGFESILFPVKEAHKFGQQIIATTSNGWIRQRLSKEVKVVPETEHPVRAVATIAPVVKTPTNSETPLRARAVLLFRELIASTLKVQPELVEARGSFAEYGLDSILIGQLTYQLRRMFSNVTSTLFFEVQSIDGLVDYFFLNNEVELSKALTVAAEMAPKNGTTVEPHPPAAASISPVAARTQQTADPYNIGSDTNIYKAIRQPLGVRAESEPGCDATWSRVDIAVIGLSGRYPNANGIDEFWNSLSEGLNSITEIPRNRWKWEEYFDAEKGKTGKIYTKWGGFIDGIDKFDPLFFKISPKEAKRMDPQERLFLEASYHAIEDAGYTPAALASAERVGVFVGAMNARYTPQPSHFSIANRVSYVFNFQGPSLAVDTACSSSLTAIHLALESLYSGSSSCAIAGGVNLIIDPVHFQQLAEMTMLSTTNQSRAFGDQADGFVGAEGVGSIVLKPLKQAELDGDHIYGVLKGSAVNAGGRTNGYTVPSPQAQSKVIVQALSRANVRADQISYIEAHGTGTKLGDPIEIAALSKAFGRYTEERQFCAIGSVKSNIGHCESAAGIAGLTKVLLQMKYEQLVPSLHADVVNPEIDFSSTPFKVQRNLERWQRPLREANGVQTERSRVAGISSFGAGGSNAHLIVEEYVGAPAGGVEVGDAAIVMSARTAEQLREKARELLEFIRRPGGSAELGALAYTLQVGREAMEERLGVVAGSMAEVEEKLSGYLEAGASAEGVYAGRRNAESVSLFDGDADLRETVEKWLGKGKLDRLLELWVKGVEVDWSKLYAGVRPRRMSLPGYPFARERYWIDVGAGSAAPAHGPAAAPLLHPLLHRNVSDLSEQRYSSTFSGEEFFFTDHQLNGHKIFPAAAYLEMARAAIVDAVKGSPDTSLELFEVVWSEPILLPARVDIRLATNEGDEVEYEICTGGAEEAIVHCRGRAVLGDCATPVRLDFAKLKSGSPGEALAELRLPAGAGGGSEYGLHPSLLDGGLQAAMGLLGEGAEGLEAWAGPRVPFALERLRLLSGWRAEMYAWVRLAAGSRPGDSFLKLDIDLCHPDGTVCLQMLGLSLRPVSREPDVRQFEPTALPLRKSVALLAKEPQTISEVERSKPTGIILIDPETLTADLGSPDKWKEPPSEQKVRITLAEPVENSQVNSRDTGLYWRGGGVMEVECFGVGGEGLEEVLRRAGAEASLKVLLLSGVEGCFGGGGGFVEGGLDVGVYRLLAGIGCPVIGVVRGDALGAGFLAAGLCDLLVLSEAGRYGYGERGPAPGVAELLGARFGRAQAEDLLYTRRSATGGELRARGWSCAVVPAAELAAYGERLAWMLAAKPEGSLRRLKQHLARRVSGLVEGLGYVAPGVEGDAGARVECGVGELESPSARVRLERRAARVLVVRLVGAEAGEVLEALSCLSAVSDHRSVVLAGELAATVSGAAAVELGRGLMELAVPVAAALEGDARGAGWLVSQYCEACVHSRGGQYSAAGLGGAARAAAAVFGYRLGELGAEVLLSGAEYSGAELERRGARAAERSEVLAVALEVAASWAELEVAAVAEWKRDSAAALERRLGRLPVPALEEAASSGEGAGGVPPGVPTGIRLQSKVIAATAYPDGVVVVRMEDRQAKNMFSEAFMGGLAEVFAHIDRTPCYKVVVLTGYDSYFASGGTKESLLAIQQGQAKFTDHRVFQAAVDCRLPVIAAMQGHGIGAGWTLGLLADVVLLSEESRYVSPYMNYGFTPGAGATYALPGRLGEDLGRESLLTGQMYSGVELRERGVRQRVLPRAEVEGAGLALAGQMAVWPRGQLIEWKHWLSGPVREALEAVYPLELAMHEQTFVGEPATRTRIEEKFGAAGQPAAVAAPVATGGAARRNSNGGEVQAVLRTLLAGELLMRESDIDEQAQFVDLGLDSISGVTWVRKINERYRTSIEATKVYSYPTLVQLARHVMEEAEKQGTLPRVEELEAEAAPVRGTAAEPSLPPGAEPGLRSRRGRSRFPRVPGMQNLSAQQALAPEPAAQPAAATAGRPAIAVIGMAGQFPQAKNVEQYWRNLAEGRDCVTAVAAERWDAETYYQPGNAAPGKTNSRWLGALEDYDRFDPLFFNISPTEAESMDPQQRLFLEACWNTVENAGYDARRLSGSRCGVFAGCASGHYHQHSRQHQLSAQGFTGSATSILAARIAYFLNLQGPCLAIDTACSSSLVALAHACDSLAGGGSDLALAGGVYVMAGPELHIMTAQAGMLSPEGKCYTFDQRADGFVPGEGVGVVLLKRLADAERDGDIIYGVVEGWGINQDGRTNGITAPNPESQTRLEQEVYDKYGIDPESIQLIEAHGTGTRLGDPIEVEGLKKAFEKYTRRRQYCALGSVKSNIGHCATAAGIAGVIKLLLALQHRQLPPTIHFERLNEHIELEGSPFYVNDRLRPWEIEAGARRQAAISSFGFSGTNAHVVLGEYRPGFEPVAAKPPLPVIVPLSARTAEQLREKARELLEFIRRPGGSAELGALAYTLQVGREAMEERLGLVAGSMAELEQKLSGYLGGATEPVEFHHGQARRGRESLSPLLENEEVKDALVEKWIAAGRVGKLLELWVKGVEVDWSKLYAGVRPRRMSLPGYPFARERYWIDVGAGSAEPAHGPAAASLLHPLLHRNVSDLSEQRYSSTFSGEEFFFTDHQLNGHKIFPAAAYLEMARAAIVETWPAESVSVELRNAVWLKPLLFEEHPHVTLALSVNDDDQIGYEIYSNAGGEEIVHCQGEAAFSRHFDPVRLDLGRLRAQMKKDQLTPSAVYAMFAKMGLDYGPAHQGIMAVYLGEKQLLAHLRLPRVVEATHQQYVLHPSLMDSALQSCIGLTVDMQRLPDSPSVPFSVKSVSVAAACVPEMFAWVRYAQASQPKDRAAQFDIDLCNFQGNVCVQIRGASFLAVDNRAGITRKQSIVRSHVDYKSEIKSSVIFDEAFYQRLIADVLKGEVSVAEAVELG